MDLTHDDVKKIIEFIDGAQHLEEFELAYGGFRLHVKRGGAGGGDLRPAPATMFPAATAAPAPVAPDVQQKAAPAEALAEGEIAIRAPMLGTFYRSPSPGEPAFVEVGQRVRADDTVCLIEVMKLFSSIRAGVDGVIARILPDNGAFVEYDQPLVVIAAARGQP